MQTIIVTGGLGFLGSQVIKHLLAFTNDEIVNVDKMTYAAVDGTRFIESPQRRHSTQLNMLRARYHARHVWLGADVTNEAQLDAVFRRYNPDVVIHLAAESHVDRSIDDNQPFMQTNLLGTQKLLEACVRHPHPVRFIQVSTDEVYGPYPCRSRGQGFDECQRLNPRNPYAATKAGAEHLVMACHHTYGLEVCITRGCNTYGPYQHPEKFLPLFILNAVEDKPLPLYGDGQQSREWLHVTDHARAIVYVLEYGTSGMIYNVGSGERHTNLEVAENICAKLDKHPDLIRHVMDRPGHDTAYAITTLALAGQWEPKAPPFLSDDPELASGLSETIKWYKSTTGRAWCDKITATARDRCGIRITQPEFVVGLERKRMQSTDCG